jgi:hypothetical protein
MSAIAVEDGKEKNGFRLLRNAWTDSHSDLIEIFNLKDNDRLSFARVEFSPKDTKDIASPDAYQLTIDEGRCPAWFDAEKQEACANQMRGWVKAMIVTKDRKMLCGGAYIIAGTAKIGAVKNCYIPAILGSANIGDVYGSANIGDVYGSANIGDVYDSANIGSVRDSANIGYVCDSAKIGYVYGSAKILNDRRKNTP